MSKLEPQIDMKKECVEPISIWKNGNELEELEKRIDKNIKEATTLTNFINSFEQMQK